MFNEQPLPTLVIPHPKTEAGRKLAELHAQAVEASRHPRARCRRAERDAHDAVRAAESALAAELDRSAATGAGQTRRPRSSSSEPLRTRGPRPGLSYTRRASRRLRRRRGGRAGRP